MPENSEVFQGTVGRIICPVKDNGYTVFELKTAVDTIKVAGQLGAVNEGEEVEITGCWDLENHYGKQVRAENCVRIMPTSNSSIKKFLNGCKVKGLSKAVVNRIVDEFGEFTFDVLMHSPEKLKAVEGISESDFEDISASVSNIFALRELTEKFKEYGIPPRYAQKAYAQWEAAAWETVSQDPFLLCQKQIGMSFRLADQLAEKLGLPGSFPHRLIEGMRDTLNYAALDGSTCMESTLLLNTVSTQLNAPYHDVGKAYEQAVSDQDLFAYETDSGTYVYLPEFFRAEDYIAGRIAAKLRFSPNQDFDCAAAIAQDEAESGIQYEELQKQAITTAFSRGIMIMTGGPGTGKTTTIKGIIHLCERANSKILLAAPTGRAAKRMTELTGYPASTIHRLLGAVPEEDEQFTFQHNENDPLKADVLIIDEFSMVDTVLFESLLLGMSLTCRLILVGDEDQLPSVGAGRLLHALIESETIPVVRLNKIFRQAQQSRIVQAAHQIISGKIPDFSRAPDSDCFLFNLKQSEVPEVVTFLCEKRLPEKRGYDPFSDIQVISPRKDGNPLSVQELNTMLQNALNPKKGEHANTVKFGDTEFRIGDKVMQIQNNYEIQWKKDGEEGTGIFNGDTGIIQDIDNEHNVTVDFDGRTVVFENGHVGSLTLAYATTVHKSQGSEFNAVILVLPEYMGQGLQNRNLLYTAVTRAKELLLIFGRDYTIERMVSACQTDTRCSCLTAMLKRMVESRPAFPSAPAENVPEKTPEELEFEAALNEVPF